MAITINGSGTITGISAGGLPDGSVTAADIESSLDLSGKTVTLPAGTGGKVLQVVTASYSTQVALGGSTWTNTNLSASITPSSTSSKILIIVNQPMQLQANTTVARDYSWRLLRAGTAVLTQTQQYQEEYNTGYAKKPLSIGHANYLDSPSTTSSTTYSTQIWLSATSADVYAQHLGCTSVITLMEIAG